MILLNPSRLDPIFCELKWQEILTRMKTSIIAFFACLLILMLIPGCRCKPDTRDHPILRDAIPYSLGSTFQMLDTAGRVVSFQDTLEQASIQSDQDQYCNCCDVNYGAVTRTILWSSTDSITIELREAAGATDANGIQQFDGLAVYVNGRNFSGAVTDNGITGVNGMNVNVHTSQLIGNQIYTKVNEIDNGLTAPYLGAHKIWYTYGEGILKIEFTDGNTLTIDN
jgi:hypothetical protein